MEETDPDAIADTVTLLMQHIQLGNEALAVAKCLHLVLFKYEENDADDFNNIYN